MKLTKENIYINLRGKSKEELTDLYNFLESVGEKQFREPLNDFLDDYNTWIAYEFITDYWVLSSNNHSLDKKTEVTIEQLKEILKPMEEVLTLENVKVDCRGLTGKEIIKISDIIYNKKGTRPELTANGYIVHGHQPMRTIISYEKFMELFGNKEILEQQLKKAEAEVKRLKEAIEDSKIKIGDWVKYNNNLVIKVEEDKHDLGVLNESKEYKKITNPELIKLLEQEIK